MRAQWVWMHRILLSTGFLATAVVMFTSFPLVKAAFFSLFFGGTSFVFFRARMVPPLLGAKSSGGEWLLDKPPSNLTSAYVMAFLMPSVAVIIQIFKLLT